MRGALGHVVVLLAAVHDRQAQEADVRGVLVNNERAVNLHV